MMKHFNIGQWDVDVWYAYDANEVMIALIDDGCSSKELDDAYCMLSDGYTFTYTNNRSKRVIIAIGLDVRPIDFSKVIRFEIGKMNAIR